MDRLDLKSFCSKFLEDQRLGDLLFFKDEEFSATYRELITLSLSLSATLKKETDDTYALQIESSYFLFAHLLGSIFAGKKALVLSSKEPENAILDYKKRLEFNRIIRGVIGEPYAENLPEIKPDAQAMSILSSGSSGKSKNILLTLDNVYFSAKSLIDFFPMKENETTFMNLPHHHVGGLMILWRAFFSHGSVTTIESEKFEYISLVPLQLKRFMEDPFKLSQLKKCKAILIGGAPFDFNLKTVAKSQGLSVYETYGMSETSSLVLLNGQPLSGQEVRLDENGHFMIKGPTLSPNAPRDNEGFFHTKDVGAKNSDGTFSFKYRSDILFKSAGELINPLEIEMKLKTLSWIKEAVSVAIRHPEWTEAQALVYKTTDSSKNASDIKEFLKKEVHPFQVPRFFYEANEGLFKDGIKPKRFEITRFAQECYFKTLLHYLHIPQPSAKKLVVFFHGFMEDHTDMIPLMDNHQEIAYLFIDFPGHGKSKTSVFKNRTEVFSQISELIKFIAEDLPYTIYGYSMGGRVALELAMNHLSPELLVLESASFGPETEEEKTLRLKSDQLLFKSATDLKSFFNDWYKNPIFADYNKSSHFESDVAKKISHDKNEWQSSLDFISPGLAPYTLNECIEKLNGLKIVGISGSLDEKYNGHYKKISGLLKNFDHHEIKKAGHNPHKTHLNEVKGIFLRSLTL